MKKKVLVISASPRRGGNSDILCDEFLRGARDAGHDAEKIFFRDKNVNFCAGCEACYNSGRCVQKDDMAEILDKMIAAHVLVLATPVYFYAMDGQLKTLIDRTVPRYRELTGKAYLIATCAEGAHSAVEGTLMDFRNFLRCATGLEEAGTVFGYGAWKKGDVKGNPAMEQAYRAGLSV